MNEIELKYISPYFPYNLKLTNYNKTAIFELLTLSKSLDIDVIDINETWNYENHKTYNIKHSKFLPILKPIEELSKKIIEEFYCYNKNLSHDEKIIELFCEENGVDDLLENIDLKTLPYNCIEYMFKNHYDFFGLIEKNIAINYKELKF